MSNDYRMCEYGPCRKKVASVRARYCGPEHRAAQKRVRQREQREDSAVLELEADWLDLIDRDGMSIDAVYEDWHQAHGSTGNNSYPSRAQLARLIDKARELRADKIATDGWEPGEDYEDWFPYTYQQMRDAAQGQIPAYPAMLDALVAAFVRFEQRFFLLPSGDPFIREQFHMDWIRAILHNYFTGGYLQILSPPRHGKSELLVHFCAWLIAWNPNIRILWVGPNLDLAKIMVSSVKEQLEDNEDLINTLLPPGQYWKPQTKSGGIKWSEGEFKVETRTVVGIKAPTMLAVGRSGKILSRDADLIVADDIEDHDSTAQPGVRAATRRWFGTQLDSRKEEHTGMVVIGSRQHPDDLYGYHLESTQWETIVNTAHDEDGCEADPDDYEAHVDCMLFPQIRSYRWLMSKKHGADDRDEEGIYEMVYLNDPAHTGVSLFSKDAMHAARNETRGIGLDEVPYQFLIAGLDPAATGYQAAFLWAVGFRDTEHGKKEPFYWMVDMENRQGGGIDAFLDVGLRWHQQYGVKHWVVEENGFQRAIRQDPRVREWSTANQIFLEPHQTQGGNKHDPAFGVGSMARLYPHQVDLPYGTPEARNKTQQYIKQALAFDANGLNGNRSAKSDILMASWFPMRPVRRMLKEHVAEVEVDYTPMFSGYTMTEWSQAPWN